MTSKVLTPLQEQVLTALFTHGLTNSVYYLTGGTALSEFYLQHRYSDDLDLFTRKSESLRQDFERFRDLLTALGFVIDSQSLTEAYMRLFIHTEDREDSGLKVEFARDVPARMAPTEVHGRIVSILLKTLPSTKFVPSWVDSHQNRKISAISFSSSLSHAMS